MTDNPGIKLPMCELTTDIYARAIEEFGFEANNLKAVRLLESATPQLWEMSCKQYDAFAPGKYEWPALKRRCDRADPSYKH